MNTATDAGWRLEDTYARLPDVFFTPAAAAPFREPKLVLLNHRLAEDLGLDPHALSAEVLAGQDLPPGARPIAQAYAGHQFGHFTMLGDGRAILLGEQRAPSGRLVDVQLKGPGRTRYSRGGDGKAALGPMLREFVISEGLFALGLPTTRSLAVVTTGEPVYRETVRRGAVLTRVAASHVRVGTFEYAAALGDEPALRALADYAIRRHDPGLEHAPDKHLAFLRAVTGRQAALIARWQLVGFIHGVMNTDNMAVSGETIDYGPCAFMNVYDPKTVFSSIDRAGRYAYGNQPRIGLWNLARLAESLLPLIDPDPDRAVAAATEVLGGYDALFERHWLDGMRQKLGLRTAEPGDVDLAQGLLDWMQRTRADFTNTFRGLSPDAPPADELRAWHDRWRGRSPDRELMRSVNPAVIPRNHLVEEALAAAEDRDDFGPVHKLLGALASPYEDRPGLERYREAPADECGYKTFCGT